MLQGIQIDQLARVKAIIDYSIGKILAYQQKPQEQIERLNTLVDITWLTGDTLLIDLDSVLKNIFKSFTHQLKNFSFDTLRDLKLFLIEPSTKIPYQFAFLIQHINKEQKRQLNDECKRA